MPQIAPIHAIGFPPPADGDLSAAIAPPYDVLDEQSKAKLVSRCQTNIAAVDLPHLPPKTVGPDATYQQAGERYRQWLEGGVLARRDKPALFAYQQTYTVDGRTFKRRGLMANIQVQPFGRPGGVHPHEQTFSSPKEDRLKLMRATGAQLSPIFGICGDGDGQIGRLLAEVIDGTGPDMHAATDSDGVLHEAWVIDTPAACEPFIQCLRDRDVFIADGHHRYNTALNYRDEIERQQGSLPSDHRAGWCMFVLVSMQDPGMIVLPTHRVLGGMTGFSIDRFAELSAGVLNIDPFPGDDLASLESALPKRGPHAIGLYTLADDRPTLAVATTVDPDPLKQTHQGRSDAWRQLNVAVVQHLIVERLCQPNLCPGEGEVTWKFPHSLEELRRDTDGDEYQLGLVMQPTPLDSVRQVSEAGELMPQKSTFFYPKLATGLAINPLE